MIENRKNKLPLDTDQRTNCLCCSVIFRFNAAVLLSLNLDREDQSGSLCVDDKFIPDYDIRSAIQ